MKKIIFVSQQVNGYADEILEVMKNSLGFEVLFIENRYGYKNIWERLIGNLIYKPFLKKDYKIEKYCNNAIKQIKEFGEFDEVFFINPEGSSEKIIKFLKAKGKPMRAHYWDSSKFMKDINQYIDYFNYRTSFDPEDCKKYNMKFLPNFYIERLIKNVEKKYDFFTVMMYDERFGRLEILAEKLDKLGMNNLFMVLDKKKIGIKSDFIKIIDNPISIEEAYEYMSMSRGVIELGREHRNKNGEKIYQGGLTFRAIESVGNKEKLITDYDMIKDYDFYDKRDIFIIPRDGDYEISQEFLKSDYKDLPKKVYEKYSCKSWIKIIFETEERK